MIILIHLCCPLAQSIAKEQFHSNHDVNNNMPISRQLNSCIYIEKTTSVLQNDLIMVSNAVLKHITEAHDKNLVVRYQLLSTESFGPCFFTRHGRPWSNPRTQFLYLWWLHIYDKWTIKRSNSQNVDLLITHYYSQHMGIGPKVMP